MIRVFLSSVFRDLENVRDRLQSDLRKAGKYDIHAMEEFAARPHPPLEVCLEEVRKSDVLLLIVGPHPGSRTDGGITYTHAEVREAIRLQIPILAVIVPREPRLARDQITALNELEKDTKLVATPDYLGSGQPLTEVSGMLLASLIRAQEAGVVGPRFSAFLPPDRFFKSELSASLAFNHVGMFVGRDNEVAQLISFMSSGGGVQVLTAAGGMGKTRLLLECAHATRRVAPTVPVMFMKGGDWLTADDIRSLPAGDLCLVVDDAHRDANLRSLVDAVRKQSPNARFVLACRPAGSAEAARIAGSLNETDCPTLQLARVPRKELVRFAESELGPAFRGWASALVDVADGNLLVIKVGARCVADESVHPELLVTSPRKFQSVVLDRLMDDPLLTTASGGKGSRELLTLLATVGPVVQADETLASRLAGYLGTKASDVRATMAKFERSGLLRRRGARLHVSPDVLADHLLASKAIDENGTPTGYIEEVLRKFADTYMENILANAAELDWRTKQTGGSNAVLDEVWASILRELPTQTAWSRNDLLRKLKRAANFAPEKVLEIVEWALDHPETPPDRAVLQLGLEIESTWRPDAATELLRFIGGAPELTRRCLVRLWRLAEADTREPNTFPNHPRRLLHEMLQYDASGLCLRPGSAQETTIDFLIEHLTDRVRAAESRWAVELVRPALLRLPESSRWSSRSIRIGCFALNGWLPRIADRRNRLMACLETVAMSSRLSEAAAAIQQLVFLTEPERGIAGAMLTEADLVAWQAEAESAIAAVVRIANSAPEPLTRYLARRAIRAARRRAWPALSPALRGALASALAGPDELLYDLVCGAPLADRASDFDAHRVRVAELSERAAAELLKGTGDVTEIVQRIVRMIEEATAAGVAGDTDVGSLFHSIAEMPSVDAATMLKALFDAGEIGWCALRFVALPLYSRAPAAVRVALEAAMQEREPIRECSVLEAIEMLLGQPGDGVWMQRLFATSSRSESASVRRAVATAIWRSRSLESEWRRGQLLAIPWNGDIGVAECVMRALGSGPGFDPASLKDEEVDDLVGRIGELPELSSRSWQSIEFLDAASARRPWTVARMLVGRIKRRKTTLTDAERRTDPIPSSGADLQICGWRTHPEYLQVLEYLRDAVFAEGLADEHWMPILFRMACGSFETAFQTVHPWIDSLDEARVVAAAKLLRAFDNEAVFRCADSVAKLIEAAARCSSECREDVEGVFFRMAAFGQWSGDHGEPPPRFVAEEKEAIRLRDRFINHPEVSGFFSSLARNARAMIDRHLKDFPDDDDDPEDDE